MAFSHLGLYFVVLISCAFDSQSLALPVVHNTILIVLCHNR